jgi:hypothetical protein
MNISIPDTLPKFLILIGIICIAVGGYVDKELLEKYYNKFDRFDEIQDEVALENFVIELEKEKLIKLSNQLSNKYNVQNPIVVNDSLIIFNQIISGGKYEVIVSDSIDHYWNKYLIRKENLKILEKRKELNLDNFEAEERILESNRNFYNEVLGIGIVFFILGVSTWIFDVYSSPDKIKQTEKMYRFCQSCGHHFSSFRLYGTNKDKTQNLALCIECYRNGKIKDPELSKNEFLELKRKEIKDLNWLNRVILMKRFKSLERWNKDYN